MSSYSPALRGTYEHRVCTQLLKLFQITERNKAKKLRGDNWMLLAHRP